MPKVIDKPQAARAAEPAPEEEAGTHWPASLERAAPPPEPVKQQSAGGAGPVSAAAVSSTSSAGASPAAGADPANDNVVRHTVQEGDSLWSISRQYDRPFPEVLKANPQFRDPDLIHPGETVNVPMGAPRQAPPALSLIHI